MSTWSGKFSSTQYPPGVAHGRFQLELDPNKQTFSTPVTLMYDGMYKHGTVIDSLVQVTPEKMVLNPSPGQLITFTVSQKTPQHITGKYFSTGPSDQGSFLMVPGTEFPSDGSCTIL